MKRIKIILLPLLSFPSIFFLFLALGKEGSIKFINRGYIKEQNTFLILGLTYLFFWFLFVYGNRKRKELDFYDIFSLSLFFYSILSIPKLFNLTYFAEHFVYLANSLCHFRLDILPSGYIDDPVIHNGKIYVAFPPFPALLMIPFALIFKTKFHDFIFQVLFGSLNVSLFFELSKRYIEILKISVSKFYKILIPITFGFGTVHLSILHFEGVWYVAHTVSVTFLLLAIIETLKKRRIFLVGLFWSFSIMTRFHLILAFPYFIFIALEKDSSLFSRKNIRNVAILLIPVIAVLILMGVYNYLRFGDFKDFGYLKMRLNEPYSEYIKSGQFNIKFLPKNLYYMLLAPPKFQKGFPFFKPDPWGMGIIFCSPIFLLLYRSLSKKIIPLLSWTSIFLILIPILLYYTTGGAQYGYRFIMDFLPFLVILFVESTNGKIKTYEYFLILISILVNLRGIYWEFIF